MQLYYKKPDHWLGMYGALYFCDHPYYNRCTLYSMNGKGLAVIQQRFDPKTKKTWWDALDPWLADDIYLSPKFLDYFKTYANKEHEGLYHTVTVRQLMHSLGMRPLEKQQWETRF